MANQSASLGLLSSLAASLCCITPLVVALGGVSGVASTLSWIEPARPYLIATSVLLLGLAWFQKLRTPKSRDCDCEGPQKRSFLQSTSLLTGATILAVMLMAFPSYSSVLFPSNKPVAASAAPVSARQIEFAVRGMGCASCEPEVETAVAKLPGIYSVKASALKKNTVVMFDPAQTSIHAIREAINSTGYTIQYVKP